MADAPDPREHLLEGVLHAALGLLAARQDRMVTIDEWAALARAVAACQQQHTAAYLTDNDLDDIAQTCSPDWNEATDGPLPKLDE